MLYFTAILAAVRGDKDLLEKLLLNSNNNGSTAFHYSCHSSTADVVNTICTAIGENKQLLEKMMLHSNTYGDLPLSYGCSCGATEAVIAILDALTGDKELLRKVLLHKNNEGLAALNYCYQDMLKAILASAGDDKVLLSNMMSECDHNGYTALHHACSEGATDVVLALLDSMIPDEKVLQTAYSMAQVMGKHDTAEVMLSKLPDHLAEKIKK